MRSLGLETSSCVYVGGTGGSGTRLIVKILSKLRIDLGGNLNDSLDNLYFSEVYDQYLHAYLRDKEFSPDFSAALRRAFLLSFKGARENRVYCIKNPRSMYVWPVLESSFHRPYYLHVIRDAGLMVNSVNQNQYNQYARFFIDYEEFNLLNEYDRRILFWIKSNRGAYLFGKALGRRFMSISYSDACADPVSTAKRFSSWLGVPIVDLNFDQVVSPNIRKISGLEPSEMIKSNWVLSQYLDAKRLFGI